MHLSIKNLSRGARCKRKATRESSSAGQQTSGFQCYFSFYDLGDPVKFLGLVGGVQEGIFPLKRRDRDIIPCDVA